MNHIVSTQTKLQATENDIDNSAPVSATEEAKNDSGKIMVFGLNLKDPQDILTIFLVSVIGVNTVDLIMYYAQKLLPHS